MKYFGGTTCFACYDKNLIRSPLKLDRNLPFTVIWVAIFGVAEISVVIFQLVYKTVKHACKVSKIRTINGAWQWVSPHWEKIPSNQKRWCSIFFTRCACTNGLLLINVFRYCNAILITHCLKFCQLCKTISWKRKVKSSSVFPRWKFA